jgi:hypothetical protein
MQFEEGLICFASPKKASFIQKCISFFTGSRFTHSFIVFKEDGVLKALETTPTIVVANPIDEKYKEGNYIEGWRPTSKEDSLEICKKTLVTKQLYLGKWYAYFSYIWFIYRYFARLLGKEPKTMWKWCANVGPFVITCTELTCYSLPQEFIPNQDINTIAPRELREHFKSSDKVMCVGVINE